MLWTQSTQQETHTWQLTSAGLGESRTSVGWEWLPWAPPGPVTRTQHRVRGAVGARVGASDNDGLTVPFLQAGVFGAGAAWSAMTVLLAEASMAGAGEGGGVNIM